MENGLTRLTEIHTRRIEICVLSTACGPTRSYHPSDLCGQLLNGFADGDDTLLNSGCLFRCTVCRSKRLVLGPYIPEAANPAT